THMTDVIGLWDLKPRVCHRQPCSSCRTTAFTCRAGRTDAVSRKTVMPARSSAARCSAATARDLRPSKLPNPPADDGLQRRPVTFDVLARATRHEAALLGEPLDQASGIRDLQPRCRVVPHLRPQVEDELDAVPGAQVEGREVIRCPKARCLPFD